MNCSKHILRPQSNANLPTYPERLLCATPNSGAHMQRSHVHSSIFLLIKVDSKARLREDNKKKRTLIRRPTVGPTE